MSESGRQAHARGEAIRLLVGEVDVDETPRRDAKLSGDRDAITRRDAAYAEANSVLDEWSHGHSYTEALCWIRDGITSPYSKDATKHADRPKRATTKVST